ncbi:MAG: hypothetical protein ACK5VV_02635, partial [Lysobacteraceae bacterium]
ITHLPGSDVATAAVAVSLIAAMTGSASGGQAIALPILAPAFLAQGVNPDQLHRSVAISSGVLDSLPHNGYVVTTIRAICGETHKDAYLPVGALTVLLPGLGRRVCHAHAARERTREEEVRSRRLQPIVEFRRRRMLGDVAAGTHRQRLAHGGRVVAGRQDGDGDVRVQR